MAVDALRKQQQAFRLGKSQDSLITVYFPQASYFIKVQSTPDNSNLLGKSKNVRVIGSLKQITGDNKISEWGGGGGCNLATKYTGMDTELELEGQKSKDKTLPRLL